MGQAWVVTVFVGDQERLKAALPNNRPTTAGRRDGAGLRIPEQWVHLSLAELTPTHHGVVVRNLGASTMEQTSKSVSAEVRTGGLVLAAPGDETKLRWPSLSKDLRLQLSRGEDRGLPHAVDHEPKKAPHHLGTAHAFSRSGRNISQPRISPTLRHRMAVLFRYLIEETDPPKRRYEHAAAQLGGNETPERLKAAANGLRRRVNKGRPGAPLKDLDDLGEYLVRTTRAITSRDLRPPSGGRS